MSFFLESFFDKLEALCSQHGVFKVETIGATAQGAAVRCAPPGAGRLPAYGSRPARSGDCFIAATSIPEWQRDHTLRIAQFGLQAVEAAQATPVDEDDPAKGCLSIRVGFHSGPVVAALLAGKYTLLGGERAQALGAGFVCLGAAIPRRSAPRPCCR